MYGKPKNIPVYLPPDAAAGLFCTLVRPSRHIFKSVAAIPTVPLPQSYPWADKGGAVSNQGDLEFMGDVVIIGTTEVTQAAVTEGTCRKPCALVTVAMMELARFVQTKICPLT